jgi:hypothetical protein
MDTARALTAELPGTQRRLEHGQVAEPCNAPEKTGRPMPRAFAIVTTRETA